MKTYAQHYEACCKASGLTPTTYSSLYDLTVDRNLFDLDDIYLQLIKLIHNQVSNKFDNNEGCHERTEHSIYLNEWQDITEITTLAEMLMPQIEEKVFGCNLIIEFLHIYRNIPHNKEPSASWLWHYDDCPKEFIKLMIYLNDVNTTNGCFQTISKNGEFPVIETFRLEPNVKKKKQIYKGSRIPYPQIKKMINKGYEITDITGPAGTYALLTPNIYHRGTVPLAGSKPREVMFFLIRPCLMKKSYIGKHTDPYMSKKNVKQYKLD